MRLGFGLYRHMLDADHFRFARQCGATDVIVHLCDYGVKSKISDSLSNQPVGGVGGWGRADHPGLWSLEELLGIKQSLAQHGLNFHGVENFDPAQWHDILLAGPKREAQIQQAKEQIRIFGEAGIRVFGYNFSIAGVTGRTTLTTRGGATAVGLDGDHSPELDTPIPKGMVWNMVYDPHAPEGVEPTITHEELWNRLEYFLRELVPVAERCGVILAAHPDDPPLPMVRKQPRLVYRQQLYQKLIDLVPSPVNQLECCVGSLAEMQDDTLYECLDRYAAQGKIAYVHLRNVRGKVPHYCETFIDDGEVDIPRVIGILKRNNFEGVVIPDHAPQMSCAAPWHAGMAFAMGYLKAQIDRLESPAGSSGGR